MQKWIILAGGIIGGFGLSIIISAFLTEKSGVFCPVCNGALAMEKKAIVCTSCGLKLKEEA